MRHRELSRLVWPKASDAVRETSASRLLKRLCDEGYIVRRLNSIGSYSYVLGKQGAMEISNLLNIPVCDGTRICGVQGRDVFHRTLSTAWMVEQLTSGREVLSEFAINSLGGDITKSALLQHWGRTPDGLVLHEVRDDAGNFIHYNVDWLEVEASYEGRADREKMMNIAWSLGRVGVGDEVYILPLSSVVESFQVNEGDVNTVTQGSQLVKVREEYMPVMSLERIFQVPRPGGAGSSGNNIMVVVEGDGSRVAVLGEELVGQHQVVVKNLETNYRKVPNVSGATILGDGTVALILDTGALVRRARH